MSGLTEAERDQLEVACALFGWAIQCEALEAAVEAVEAILAAREIALREAIDREIRGATAANRPDGWTADEWQAYLGGRDDQRQMDAAIARGDR